MALTDYFNHRQITEYEEFKNLYSLKKARPHVYESIGHPIRFIRITMSSQKLICGRGQGSNIPDCTRVYIAVSSQYLT